eukprot:Mrub_01856.p1 GENE.Mrub_01856~~Mrub_01856.p1  ORF type:complete len:612 (+),score=204.57 Mrub_01856:2-1837(+)
MMAKKEKRTRHELIEFNYIVEKYMDQQRLVSGMRLGTGAKRLGTGIRPIGTAMRQGNIANMRGEYGFVPVGDPNQVNVADRPITNYGLSGMKTGARPTTTNRTVKENSFYLNEILGKQTDIQKEINKFKIEMNDLEKEQSNYINLERKYEQVLKTVRNLEGELADYNLTLDKMRTDTRVEDVNMMLDHIKYQNNKQKSVLDNLFIERKNNEEKVVELERQLQEFQLETEKLLNDLDPMQRTEYENLSNENRALDEECGRKRQEIEEVNYTLSQMDQRLRLDVQRQKSKTLREERDTAFKRNEELKMQLDELNLPIDELKELFRAKIKKEEDNNKELEERAKDLKRLIDNYSKQLLEQEQQAKNKDSKSETEKYELLLNKDREIDEFFNKFDDEKQREETEVATLQDKIEQTLEELSEVSTMAENLPDEAKAKDIIGEHEFKNQALSDAKFTLEKLKIERDKLRKEMVKYEHIDKRLASEIEMNQQRIQQMSSEITDKFERVNDIKHGIEQRVEQHKLKKEFLNKKREYLLNNVRQINMKFETKKQLLYDNDTFKNLTDYENKICTSQANILSIQQYIEHKQAETNYYDQIDKVNALTAQINEIVIQQTNYD